MRHLVVVVDVGESKVSLYERIVEEKKVNCGDRMRNQFRPDAKGMERSQRTAARMSDNASSLKSALMCRDKEKIDQLMTQMGKDLVDIKNAINSKQGRRALDYEQWIMFPERRAKKVKREPARSNR